MKGYCIRYGYDIITKEYYTKCEGDSNWCLYCNCSFTGYPDCGIFIYSNKDCEYWTSKRINDRKKTRNQLKFERLWKELKKEVIR